MAKEYTGWRADPVLLKRMLWISIAVMAPFVAVMFYVEFLDPVSPTRRSSIQTPYCIRLGDRVERCYSDTWGPFMKFVPILLIPVGVVATTAWRHLDRIKRHAAAAVWRKEQGWEE